MKRLALLAAAAVAFGAPALASETPHPGAADPRVRWVDYNPQQVYRVVGVFRSATEIAFASDEEIVNVAAGDTVAWEVVPRGHLLFIKPRENAGASNLIVTTQKGTELRDYQIELQSRPAGIGPGYPDTFFKVQFRYPEDERLQRARLAAVQAAVKLGAIQSEAVTGALEHGVLEGVRNTRYMIEGASDLQPSEITDNGQFTVLRYPANHEIPTIYLVRDDGTETLVAFDVRGEFVVVHLVAKQLRLRRNQEVLCIYNQAPPTWGVNYGTDTATPYVKRTIKEPTK